MIFSFGAVRVPMICVVVDTVTLTYPCTYPGKSTYFGLDVAVFLAHEKKMQSALSQIFGLVGARSVSERWTPSITMKSFIHGSRNLHIGPMDMIHMDTIYDLMTARLRSFLCIVSCLGEDRMSLYGT